MALASYARNLYAPQAFIDVNLVTIVITAAGRDASRSSPDTAVGAGASGAYVCTMPSGVKQVLVGADTVNSSTDKVSVTSLSSSGGVTTFTATKSDGANAAGSEEIHLSFLVF